MKLRLICAAGAVTSAVVAQPGAPPPLPAPPGHYLLQSLLSLLVVVALIYGVYWLLRRLGPNRAAAGQSGPAELVQSLPLHGSHVLHVVRLGSRLIGIACGPGGVAAVDVADEPTGVVAAAEQGGEE